MTAFSLDLPSSQAMRCSVNFRAIVLLGVVALVTALYQSTQTSAAPTITAPLTGWSNAVDEPRRFDINAAATEHAGLRVEEKEGAACPPWWLPPFLANHGQVHSGNQVLAHVDVHDGKHRDFMSHQPAEQPEPADSPSHLSPSFESLNLVRPLSCIAKGRETINSWTSCALLSAFVFLLSVCSFNGKVPTPFLPARAAWTLLFALLHPLLSPAPCSLCSLLPAPRAHPEPSTLLSSAPV